MLTESKIIHITVKDDFYIQLMSTVKNGEQTTTSVAPINHSPVS